MGTTLRYCCFALIFIAIESVVRARNFQGFSAESKEKNAGEEQNSFDRKQYHSRRLDSTKNDRRTDRREIRSRQEDKNHDHFTPLDFMLDLYRVYNKDEKFMLSQSKLQGDTIRSFFPVSAGRLYIRLKNIRLTFQRIMLTI